MTGKLKGRAGPRTANDDTTLTGRYATARRPPPEGRFIRICDVGQVNLWSLGPSAITFFIQMVRQAGGSGAKSVASRPAYRTALAQAPEALRSVNALLTVNARRSSFPPRPQLAPLPPTYQARVEKVFIVNANTAFSVFLSLCSSVFTQKFLDTIACYGSWETERLHKDLLELIDAECLPVEFGGCAPAPLASLCACVCCLCFAQNDSSCRA